MSDWKIRDHTEDRWIDVDSRKEGEDKLEDFEGELELELQAPDGRTVEANFDHDEVAPETEAVEPEVIDETEPTETAVGDSGLDETKQEVTEAIESAETQQSNVEIEPQQDIQQGAIDLKNPEAHLPSWMLSEITHGNGETGIDLNKDGTQVVSAALGLEVNAECEVSAHETDFEYARYRATVKRPDGRTFNAVGDAHIDENGKSKWDLERLAETRACKRAVKWASAGGIEALEKVRE